MRTTTSKRAPRRRHHGSRGYTTVEVMIAMTVFAVGAAGVIGMQKASVQGNLDARRMDVANGIAREWMERLRRDGLAWTSSSNFASTSFLSTAGTSWGLPAIPATAAAADGASPAFDILGRDLYSGSSPSLASLTAFCAQIRVTPMIPNTLLRAEVRVFWPRQINTTPAWGSSGFCSATGVAYADLTTPVFSSPQQIFHFVYAASVVRINGQ